MPQSRAVRLRNHLYALWKLSLSLLKRDWGFDDYPVVVQRQLPDPALKSVHQPYMAFIVNWGLSATGDSEGEALRNLETNFETAKMARAENQKPLPRPGTTVVPVEFSSTERVNAHSELADDFIRRVLELEWAWISDESSLWDFNAVYTNDALVAKIRDVYGVDVSAIESARLCEILEAIAAVKKQDAER